MTSPASVSGLPSTLLVAGNQLWGTYTLPSPTIIMIGQSTAHNSSGTAAVDITGTSWQVIDMNASVVGTGTMLSTAASITPCSGSVWGGTGTVILPGHYTVSCSNGATGSLTINRAGSNLWIPASNYTASNGNSPPISFAAYMGSARDRDLYSIPQVAYTDYSTGGAAAAAIVQTIGVDAYYGAAGASLDSARPRELYIAPSPQSPYPTQNPTPAYWAACAASLVTAGHSGAWYELPTNEPESGGWPIADTISYWNQCASVILAADPTAKLTGWCSEGIYSIAPISNVASFLASCGASLSAISNHMEASNNNMGDFVGLRQYYGGIKAQMVASGYPDLDYWNTETGIQGGQYGVLQPRREARQRTMIRFVAEQFGWSSQKQYDFEVFDHQGSGSGAQNGLPMYLVDKMEGNNNGNIRAGAYAVRVFNDALWGTTCTVASPPATLSFGASGGMADSLFAGSHYSNGVAGDVVILATNLNTAASVTLNVSGSGTVTWWDGMGVPGTLTISGGKITVPVNDLLTYVFLATGTTVSVHDTDQGAVTLSALTNLALSASVVNESSTAVPLVHDGNWGKNNNSTAGVTAPYIDTGSPPYSISVAVSGGASVINGFAFNSPAAAWQLFGCGISAANVTIDGTEVWSYTDATAVSYSVPSPSNGNSDDPCTRTSWCTSPYGFVYTFPTPLSGSVIKFNITDVYYGGQPDIEASTNSNSLYNENDPQNLQLAQVAVYGESSGPMPTITLEGTYADYNQGGGLTGQTTPITVTPAVGDLLVWYHERTAGSGTASGLSGGGVTTWNSQVVYTTSADIELWYGVVTTAGAASVTTTLSSTQLWYGAFSHFRSGIGSATEWAVVASGPQVNGSSATLTGASLTSNTVAEQVYAGMLTATSTITAGSTSGFVYNKEGSPTGCEIVTNVALASSTTYQPTATQATAAANVAVGAIFSAVSPGGGGGTPIPAAPTGPGTPELGWRTLFGEGWNYSGSVPSTTTWYCGQEANYDDTNNYSQGFNCDGTPPVPGGDFATFNKQMASVGSGVGTLTLQAIPGAGSVAAGPNSGSVETIYNYQGGALNSIPHASGLTGDSQTGFVFTPGTLWTVMEWDAQVPSGPGLWTDLWCSTQTVYTNEIDMAEGLGTNDLTLNVHYCTGGSSVCNAQTGPHTISPQPAASVSHLWTVAINDNNTPGLTTFWIDGVQQVQWTVPGWTNPMGLIADFALSSIASSVTSQLPQAINIKSVAVYQENISVNVPSLDTNNVIVGSARDNLGASVYTSALAASVLAHGTIYQYNASVGNISQTLPASPSSAAWTENQGYTLGFQQVDATNNALALVAGGADVFNPAPYSVASVTVGSGNGQIWVYENGVWTNYYGAQAAPYREQTVFCSTSGSVTTPWWAGVVDIQGYGSGSSGGGGGAAALTSGVTGQVGGPGGSAAAWNRQSYPATPGSTLTYTVPNGAGSVSGGAASSSSVGNAGTGSAVGAAFTVTGTGISFSAKGGTVGNGGGANSTTTVASLAPFMSNSQTVTLAPGQGGQANSTNGTIGMTSPGGPSGGVGGAPATALLGGDGGLGGVLNVNGTANTTGHTGVLTGQDGSAAAANSGCGGGGGGGGAPGGAGGAGGAGGSGYGTITFKSS